MPGQDVAGQEEGWQDGGGVQVGAPRATCPKAGAFQAFHPGNRAFHLEDSGKIVSIYLPCKNQFHNVELQGFLSESESRLLKKIGRSCLKPRIFVGGFLLLQFLNNYQEKYHER